MDGASVSFIEDLSVLILLQVAVSFEQNQCFNLLMVVRVLLY